LILIMEKNKIMSRNILLSICIITYNRANNLNETLHSIVSQDIFNETEHIEIIVLDNGSTDGTSKTIQKFTTKYGQKIRPFRNEVNILPLNLENLFSHASGMFIKFNNDTLKHNEGSLYEIVKNINENKSDRKTLFFSNGLLKTSDHVICNNLDSFVETVSYISTWGGAFGIWKEDFNHFENFNRHSDLLLPQVDVLFRLINSGRSVLINNDKLFLSVDPSRKGGYDLLTIFLDNYTFLLNEQVEKNSLSSRILTSEKRKLLLKLILPWLVSIRLNPNTYYFEYENWLYRIFHSYRHDLLTFVKFLILYPLLIMYRISERTMPVFRNFIKNRRILMSKKIIAK